PPAAETMIRRVCIPSLPLAAPAAVSALDYPPLTPNPEAFKARREKFMSKLPPKSVAILRSAPERTMTNDVEYLYRADSDFYYLTGITQEDVVVVLRPDAQDGKGLRRVAAARGPAPRGVGRRARRTGRGGRGLRRRRGVSPEGLRLED